MVRGESDPDSGLTRFIMRVLHVIPSISTRHGGPSFALDLIARSLVQSGIEVDVATTDDDGPGQRLTAGSSPLARQDGYKIHFFPKQTEFYKVSLPLGRFVRDRVCDYNLIHIHALFSFVSISAARTARRLHVPYIVRPLGVLNRWGMENRRRFLKRMSVRMIELPILLNAAAIHYTAEAERSEAAVVHPAIAEIPSFVIPIPIERSADHVNRTEFCLLFPAVAGKRVVLFLSRLDPKKGIELLLESFKRVSAGQSDLLLVVAGDGAPSYVESLRELAGELRISENVLWTGHLGAADKAAAFAAATMFVLPSYSENFGVAAAEALAAGVPSILSDQVAFATDAREAGAAVVVRPEVDDLSSAMVHVLANTALREQLSINGATLARALYSPQAIGEALVEQYRRIVSRSKTGS